MNNAKVKVFFPNLDGLRFFAFFSVFVSHCADFMGYKSDSALWHFTFDHILHNGDLGVNFFFVLSGFLITYLLLTEKDIAGDIHVPNFYVRRILRIWPVYFIVVIIGFYVVPYLPVIQNMKSYLPFSVDIPGNKIFWYIFFAANIEMVVYGIKSLIVTVLWSVSVEEQYYLAWPWLVKKISKQNLPKIFLFFIVISLVFRFWKYYHFSAVHYFTPSVISDLTIGSFMAWLAKNKSWFVPFFEKLKRNQIILIYLLGFALIPLRGYAKDFGDLPFRIMTPIEPLIFSLFFAFIIAEQNFAINSFFKTGRSKLITTLGKYSYGLYCYHMIWLLLVLVIFYYLGYPLTNVSIPQVWIMSIMGLGLSIGGSYLSYEWIEKRFVKMKDKFAIITK